MQLKAAIFLVCAVPFAAPRHDLASDATIRRDTFGVPHILGKTEEAAARSHGYATAEDHFGVMARLFLRAEGRQAEFLGDQFLEDDVRVHQLRIPEIAAEKFQELSPGMRAILNAYADGYNRYLHEHQAGAPAYAHPVTGAGVLAHCRAVLLLNFVFDLKAWNVERAEPSPGSNMWAVGGGRSATGAGLLLVNPHLPWSNQFLVHEVHITVPGRLNVMGAAIVGSPVITMGFNDQLGWAHTMLESRPDSVESFAADDPRTALRKVAAPIRVRRGEKMETAEKTFEYTAFGPVARHTGNTLRVFRSVNFDLVEFLDQWSQMSHASSSAEFQAALKPQKIPGFNIGYADRKGNVYYLYNARLPRRTADSVDWNSVVPLAGLPQLLNPAGGYVQNCNGAPWFTSLRDRMYAGQYPAVQDDRQRDFRIQFSLQLIDGQAKPTLEGLMKLKFDTGLLLGSRLKPDLVTTLSASGDAKDLAAELETLRSWDERASAASKGAAVFELWWTEYAKIARPVFAEAWSASRPIETPRGIGDPAAAVTAFTSAVRDMRKANLSPAVAWGETHRFRQQGIDLPMSGASGSLGAFRVVEYRKDPDGKQRAVFGDSYVLAVEFGKRPRAFSVLAYSQSSDSKSKHYSDQANLFVNGNWKPTYFAEDELAQHIERSYAPPTAVSVQAAAAAK
jgi:acyl-homoserine-lactone acylase